MRIIGWIKSSTVDYPGQLATAIFTPGCNFHCAWCHNKPVWDAAEEVAPAEVLAFLRKRQGMLDGLVISGGEPTLQPGLYDFIAQARDIGYMIKLDTNGSNPQEVEQLLLDNMLDYVAMDYKGPWDRYDDICGCAVDVDSVRRTMDMVMLSGVAYELRTTVLPQLDEADLLGMAMDMPPLMLYALQLYRPLKGSNKNRGPEWLLKAADMLKPHQPNVIVRA